MKKTILFLALVIYSGGVLATNVNNAAQYAGKYAGQYAGVHNSPTTNTNRNTNAALGVGLGVSRSVSGSLSRSYSQGGNATAHGGQSTATATSTLTGNNSSSTIGDIVVNNNGMNAESARALSAPDSTVVSTNYEAPNYPVSTAVAPPLSSSNDTCMGSTSVGGQGMSFGFSAGTTWTDNDCIRRKDARLLHNMGDVTAARALMCQKQDIQDAYTTVGLSCYTGKPLRKEDLARLQQTRDQREARRQVNEDNANLGGFAQTSGWVQ